MAITSRILGERGKRQARDLGIDPERVPPGQYLTADPWHEQRHWF